MVRIPAASVPQAATNPMRAIFFKLLSVTLAVVMASLIKAASGEVPPGEAVFFRSVFAVPVILGWLAVRRELATGLRPATPMLHVGRGLLGTLGMGMFFTGLTLLPLAEVKAIQYATPLLVVIFAGLFLGEEVRAFRLTAVGAGLVGVLIILSPRLTRLASSEVATLEALGAVVVLFGAVVAALSQVVVRRMVATEPTAAIVFWFSITASCLSLITAPFGWAVPRPETAALLVLAGLLGGMAQMLLTLAYRDADAGVVAPFDYASVLIAVAIGYFVFSEVPTAAMLGGAALVVAAGGAIIWRERKLGLERARQRRAVTPQG